MAGTIQCGRRSRKDFGKIPSIVEIPNLIEVQKRSYETFLQKDVAADRREEIGLQAVFKSVFPIADYNDNALLEFDSYHFGDPKYTVEECHERGMTFAIPLKVTLRLVVFDHDKEAKTRTIREQRGQEVYLGELPLMTDKGTFIINGTERVVVSQLQRSAGVFFDDDKGKTLASGKPLYSARVIPYRGSWVEFDFDANDLLHVRVDRRRKMYATAFLRAFWFLEKSTSNNPQILADEEILGHFYESEDVLGFEEGNAWVKLSPDAHEGVRVAEDVKPPRHREPIVTAGKTLTAKLIEKLVEANVEKIAVRAESLVGRRTAARIVDAESGEVLVQTNAEITSQMLSQIMGRRVAPFKLLVPVLPGMPTVKPADKEVAQSMYETLAREDIVAVIRHLLMVKLGSKSTDDIDHLGNRRVRSVGELLENQFRVGLTRMERAVKERMSISDITNLMPHDLINAKPVSAVVKEFFGSSQLSQFMDQTNPLAELTHKRRLSALGPGGLSRDRAGFEVRDVHPSHYGRICPIETPEGPNIGLISSMSTFARINEFGFIETPYRKVHNGRVTDEVEYLTGDREENYLVAQANAAIDGRGHFTGEKVSVRYRGDFLEVEPSKVHYMDVSPKQLVSVAAGLIPFLEHDDANRALMGSNMQRQGVPLIVSEAPLVGTGLEGKVARDSRAVVVAAEAGRVASVTAEQIIVTKDGEMPEGRKKLKSDPDAGVHVYELRKFMRSNAGTCVNQKPIVKKGQHVKRGQVIADGPNTEHGELALGRNVLVAFMPWNGYNFEDAIMISEKVVKEDIYTSIHIDEFEIGARDTKLGPEEITRDIPNVSEEALRNLGPDGVVRVGAEVKPGDILVGKITPKSETELAPEERLLRAIFGEKAADVKDTSLTVPSGTYGIVMDVKVSSRREVSREKLTPAETRRQLKTISEEHKRKKEALIEQLTDSLSNVLLGEKVPLDVVNAKNGEIIIPANRKITKTLLRKLATAHDHVEIDPSPIRNRIREIIGSYEHKFAELELERDRATDRVESGDDIDPGIIKQVKVYIASKRKLSVGDKMAGRHGNKGVVARIVPEEDMPFLADGTPVEIVLNPLGVPSRMNVGQVLETHLGVAAKALGFSVATPVFDGIAETKIREYLKDAKKVDGFSWVHETGKARLFDGRTGDPFDQEVVVGYIYMMKLGHLVADKIHARAGGPYSLVTQQPLGGKAQYGGQRFGEMEVWAMEAYGAACTLQQLLTVKSDDVQGRTRIYESIVKGDNSLEAGTPESFNVLIKEMQSLGLDVKVGGQAPSSFLENVA